MSSTSSSTRAAFVSCVSEVEATKTLRVYRQSQEYQEFQPKREDGLYKKLIEEGVESCETTAKEILHTLKTEPHAALLTLIEYFLDLCGFQHVDIRKVYISSYMQLETIINHLQDKITTAHENGKYLIKGKTAYAEIVINTAYHFISNLVMQDDKFVLYYVNTPKSVIHFVSIMCTSSQRAICHTGCVIAIKMNSAYCNKYYKLNTATSVDTSYYSLKSQLRTITEIQEDLWKIIARVSRARDYSLIDMRCAFAKEMLQWFKSRPEHFLGSEIYISHFLKYCNDPSVKVTLAALKICKNMFDSYCQFWGYLKPFENRIISKVSKRIDDNDFDIAAKAVDVCTSLIDSLPNIKIAERLAHRIPTLMLCDYYPLAAAAGQFSINYLRHKQTATSLNILNGVVKIYNGFPKNNNEVALIVDSIIDCTPELHNWDLYMETLLSEEWDLTAEKYFLMEFFCHSVFQTVTGRCDIAREKPRKAHPRSGIENTIEVFVTHFNTLMRLYGKRKQNALLLLKTLDVMDVSSLTNTQKIKKKMPRLYCSLIEFFEHTTDRELAVNALKAIRTFCEKKNHFQKQAIEYYSSLEKKILECIGNYSDISQWLQLSVAMETVTNFFKNVIWCQIFIDKHSYNAECLNTSVDILKYQLMTCKWFLYYQTRAFVHRYIEVKHTEEEHNIALDKLSKDIEEYVKYIFNLLFDDAKDVVLEAFKQICEIKVHMDEILVEATKIKGTLSKLSVKMSDERVIQKFCIILQENVIHTSSPFDIKTRKMYLQHAFHWFLNGEPLKHLHKIISLYGEYYKEFGEIFDETLKSMKKTNPTVCLVVVRKSLMDVFESNSFDEHSMNDGTTLKKLAKQVAQTCMKTKAEALKLIEYSIKTICSNLQLLNFFLVLKYFVKHLGADDCVVLYENLKTKIPQEHHQHPGFLNFMLALRNKILKTEKSKGYSVNTARLEGPSVSTSDEGHSTDMDTD